MTFRSFEAFELFKKDRDVLVNVIERGFTNHFDEENKEFFYLDVNVAHKLRLGAIIYRLSLFDRKHQKHLPIDPRHDTKSCINRIERFGDSTDHKSKFN